MIALMQYGSIGLLLGIGFTVAIWVQNRRARRGGGPR